MWGTMLAYNLCQTVLLPTLVSRVSYFTLDLVLRSSGFSNCTTEVREGISDRRSVNFTSVLPHKSHSSNPKLINVTNYDAADDSNIKFHLEQTLLSFCDDNVNTLWTKYKPCCAFCICNFIPEKMKKIGRGNPWIMRKMIHLKRRIKAIVSKNVIRLLYRI